jgi:hypothetical protein
MSQEMEEEGGSQEVIVSKRLNFSDKEQSRNLTDNGSNNDRVIRKRKRKSSD